jgi:hypothetical protein
VTWPVLTSLEPTSYTVLYKVRDTDDVQIKVPVQNIDSKKFQFWFWFSSPMSVRLRGSQRDVVYLGWPIAPSYIGPNARGGGGCGSQPMSTAVHMEPWNGHGYRQSHWVRLTVTVCILFCSWWECAWVHSRGKSRRGDSMTDGWLNLVLSKRF